MRISMRRTFGLFVILYVVVAFSPRADAQVAPAVIRALAPDNGRDNNDIQKAPSFLKPLINLELSFIKRVCRPTDEQMNEIVAAAEQAFAKMSDIVQDDNNRVIRVNQGMMQVLVMGPNSERLTQNPYSRIRKDAAQYLQPILDKQQYAKYVEEAKQRDLFERESAVGIGVTLIDDKLCLQDEQRTKLFDQLLQKWTHIDILQMQMYLYNPQYIPSIDNRVLLSVLTESQMEAWRSYSATTMYIHIGHQQEAGLGEEWIK